MNTKDLLDKLNRRPPRPPRKDRLPFMPKRTDGQHRMRLLKHGGGELAHIYLEHRLGQTTTEVCPKSTDMEAPCPNCAKVEELYLEGTDEAGDKAYAMEAKPKVWLLAVPLGGTLSNKNGSPADEVPHILDMKAAQLQRILTCVAQVGGWTGDAPGREDPEEDHGAYRAAISQGMEACVGEKARDLIMTVDSKAGSKGWYKYRFTPRAGKAVEIPEELPDLGEVFRKVKKLDPADQKGKPKPSVRGRPPRKKAPARGARKSNTKKK